MATIEELKHKIISVNDLKSVVKTMKSLAAVNIHQYEKAVESLTEYDRTLKMGWQILLQRDPQMLLKPLVSLPRKVGLVVFGSDWGMCGQFNERIAEYSDRILNKQSGDRLLIANVGTRIGTCLQAKGYSCDRSFNLPSSVTGITAVIQQIVLTLENWREHHQLDHIDIIYNYIDSGIHYQSRQLQIFPLNSVWLQQLKRRKWSGSSLPVFTMDKNRLVSALFSQYFFVALYRACAESLKSESTSRLAAMQMAEKNITERLNDLSMQFNQQRQTTITEELLDIVAGFEALNR